MHSRLPPLQRTQERGTHRVAHAGEIKSLGHPPYLGGAYGYGAAYSLNMGLGPFVTFVRPTSAAGGTVQILGQGFTGTTAVTFNGVEATTFSVVSDTYMTAVVPSGATTGPVAVTTTGGTLTSNVSLRVKP